MGDNQPYKDCGGVRHQTAEGLWLCWDATKIRPEVAASFARVLDESYRAAEVMAARLREATR